MIFLRHHNLALCRNHFVERFERETLRTIRRYEMFTREEPIAVAVSGGKDSLGLLHLLHKKGFNVRGIYIDLGIHLSGYSETSTEKVRKFAETHGVEIVSVSVKQEYGFSIPELAEIRRHQKPCSTCGLVKRYLLNRMGYELGLTTIATGHNLDDEAATLFGNVIHWEEGYLLRQAPLLPSTHPKLLKRAKPFVFFTERETALYAILEGIDYVRDECPFSVDAKSIFYKHILNELENRSPGTKLRFYKGFLDFRKRYIRALPEKQEPLRECRVCGMPTTAEVCAFCRLFGKAKVQVDTLSKPVLS